MTEGDKLSDLERVSERLATNEAKYNALHDDVVKIADSIGSLGRDFRVAIDDLKQRQSDQSKTPWPALAAWASVIILVGTILGNFLARDIYRNEQSIQSNGIAILSHIANEPSRKEQELQYKILQMQIDELKND